MSYKQPFWKNVTNLITHFPSYYIYLYFVVKLRNNATCNSLLSNTVSLFYFLAKHFILFASMSRRKRTGARGGGRRLGEVCCHPSCDGRAGAKSLGWEWGNGRVRRPVQGAQGAQAGRQAALLALVAERLQPPQVPRHASTPPPPRPTDSAVPAGACAAFRPLMRGKLSTWLH